MTNIYLRENYNPDHPLTANEYLQRRAKEREQKEWGDGLSFLFGLIVMAVIMIVLFA